MSPDVKLIALRCKLKRLGISALVFLSGTACNILGVDFNPPGPTCYTPAPPTFTPTPIVEVTCYTPMPTFRKDAATKMPVVAQSKQLPPILCYVMPPPTLTPTPEPESRDALRERLLVEGRFPAAVVQEL